MLSKVMTAKAPTVTESIMAAATWVVYRATALDEIAQILLTIRLNLKPFVAA